MKILICMCACVCTTNEKIKLYSMLRVEIAWKTGKVKFGVYLSPILLFGSLHFAQ